MSRLGYRQSTVCPLDAGRELGAGLSGLGLVRLGLVASLAKSSSVFGVGSRRRGPCWAIPYKANRSLIPPFQIAIAWLLPLGPKVVGASLTRLPYLPQSLSRTQPIDPYLHRNRSVLVEIRGLVKVMT